METRCAATVSARFSRDREPADPREWKSTQDISRHHEIPARSLAAAITSTITARYFSKVSSTTVMVGIVCFSSGIVGLNVANPSSCTPVLPRPGAGLLKCSNDLAYFVKAAGYAGDRGTW